MDVSSAGVGFSRFMVFLLRFVSSLLWRESTMFERVD